MSGVDPFTNGEQKVIVMTLTEFGMSKTFLRMSSQNQETGKTMFVRDAKGQIYQNSACPTRGADFLNMYQKYLGTKRKK